MAIIIPHQLPLAPHLSPPRFQRTASQSTAVRFFVSSNLLSRFLRSAILFPLVRLPVSFVSLVCSFWSVFLFPLFRFPAPFGLLLCFLRFACLFLWVRSPVPFVSFPRSLWPAPLFPPFRFLFPLVWFYEALPRSQLLFHLVLSPPLSGIFVPLKSDTCPSTFEKTPLNV